MNEIIEQLNRIEKLLLEQSILKKEILSFKEAAIYLNKSESYLYKLTAARKITFFKPGGKELAFKRTDLDKWLLQNQHESIQNIEQEAANFKIQGRRT